MVLAANSFYLAIDLNMMFVNMILFICYNKQQHYTSFRPTLYRENSLFYVTCFKLTPHLLLNQLCCCNFHDIFYLLETLSFISVPAWPYPGHSQKHSRHKWKLGSLVLDSITFICNTISLTYFLFEISSFFLIPILMEENQFIIVYPNNKEDNNDNGKGACL